MTLVRTASLMCDGVDNGQPCDAWFGHDDRPASRMRTDAQQAGWTRRDNKDYCPNHTTTP